jgi:hypothetical protein
MTFHYSHIYSIPLLDMYVLVMTLNEASRVMALLSTAAGPSLGSNRSSLSRGAPVARPLGPWDRHLEM